MSRKTFYDLFGTRSSGLRYAFAEAFNRIFDPVEATTRGAEPWHERTIAALDAFFAAINDEPLLAELCLVHSASAPIEAKGANFEAGIETMMLALRGGREAGQAALGAAYRDPPPQMERMLSGAIVSVAAQYIRQGDLRRLPAQRDGLFRLAAMAFLSDQNGEGKG